MPTSLTAELSPLGGFPELSGIEHDSWVNALHAPAFATRTARPQISVFAFAWWMFAA
jgi:hypothetical protein